MIAFPEIDPIAIHIGQNFGIRWYALAYLAGFLGGWAYAGQLASLDKGCRPNREDIDNVLPLLVLGVILGGRIGYVLFYNIGFYLENPLRIPFIWEGGMSFHGGLMGVVAVSVWYGLKHKFHPLALGDILGTVVPIGLFFGRLANFINGELYGRITTVPWAIVFPQAGDLPRHPSQLYEAGLEGIVLFLVLFFLARKPRYRRMTGFLFGVFLTGYGLSRFIVEFYREPDVQIGFVFDYLSLGQLLTLPMIFVGLYIIQYARKHQKAA